MIGNTQTQVYPTYQYFHYPQYSCPATAATFPFAFGFRQGVKYRELVYKYNRDPCGGNWNCHLDTGWFKRQVATTSNFYTTTYLDRRLFLQYLPASLANLGSLDYGF
jgi:hypothetical protein